MSLLLIVGFAVGLVAAYCDLRHGIIPNWLTYPLVLASPFLHVGRGLWTGLPLTDALELLAASLLGILVCGAIPFFMWWKNALGGGDVKLFAGLGALLLPRLGFDAQLYVFVCAALIAPAKLAYDGALLRTLRNLGGQAVRAVTPGSTRVALTPELGSWFRLGPCFALGLAVELVLRFRSL